MPKQGLSSTTTGSWLMGPVPWMFYSLAIWMNTHHHGVMVMAMAQSLSLTTYPLIPHHVQRMRRHRERSLYEAVHGVDFEEEARPSSVQSGLRRRAEAVQVGALFQGYGTHYIDLWCGSPPQRQTVIVDTGSGITAFPCDECSNCGVPNYHIDQLFHESDSSTYVENTCQGGCTHDRAHCVNNQCKLSMSYAEGSRWDAVEATDLCYVGGPHERPLLEDSGSEDIDPNHAKNFAFNLVFGCQTLLTGLFKTQLADGIMGMDSRPEAFWNQMHKAGKMSDKKFSLCFGRQPIAERMGTEAGAMTLGGIDERMNQSPLVFSPSAAGGRSGFFSVRMRRIWLRDGSAGESAASTKVNPNEGVHELPVVQTDLNRGGIIVDSGTTDTYWNSAISDAFGKLFKKLTGMDHTHTAITLTEEQLMALPTVLFQIESSKNANPDADPYHTVGLAGVLDTEHPYDVLLAFPPSHYMEFDPDTGKYTSRFYLTEHQGSVLGANAMMGHNVLFDVDNDRIGWAESQCDYTNFVTSNGYKFEITGNLEEASPGANPAVVVDPPVAPPTEPVPAVPARTMSPSHAPEEAAILPQPPVIGDTTSTENQKADSISYGDLESGGVVDKIKTDSSAVGADLKEFYHKFLEACDTPECRYPILAGLVIAVCCGACLSYLFSCCCCACLRSKGEHHHKYTRAANDELEMVHGEFVDSYEDEPEKSETSSQSNTNGRFRDDPVVATPIKNDSAATQKSSRQPEFQGDFL